MIYFYSSSEFLQYIYIFTILVFLNSKMKILFDIFLYPTFSFVAIFLTTTATGPDISRFCVNKFISHRKVHVHKGRKNKVREAHS